MDVQTILSMLYFVLDDTRDSWVREVNSEGRDFDFDSQDSYRMAYEDCITQWRLVEQYPPSNFMENRKEALDAIVECVQAMIVLYERHRSLFRSYNRQKMMLDTYRKRNPNYGEIQDQMLMNILGLETEIPSQDEYYQSTFYHQFGFLQNDYHFYIYVFCNYLLMEVKGQFKDYDLCQTFIANAQLAPYFSMKLAGEVYELCNAKQFDSLTEFDFYKSINLMQLTSPLKIAKDETKRAYYVLHCLSMCIQNKDTRSYWLNTILNRLGKDEPNYLSRYRDTKGNNATADDKIFTEKVDRIFKPHLV